MFFLQWLYYWPRSGLPIESLEIVAPGAENAFLETPFIYINDLLPRQARDKHRKNDFLETPF